MAKFFLKTFEIDNKIDRRRSTCVLYTTVTTLLLNLVIVKIVVWVKIIAYSDSIDHLHYHEIVLNIFNGLVEAVSPSILILILIAQANFFGRLRIEAKMMTSAGVPTSYEDAYEFAPEMQEDLKGSIVSEGEFKIQENNRMSNRCQSFDSTSRSANANTDLLSSE